MTDRELKLALAARFGGSADDVRLFAAPGRVNLIGEHVDYCGGPVLPAALRMGTTIAARVRDDDVIRLAATDLPDVVEVRYGDLAGCRALPWGSYQLGVAHELMADGYPLRGCDLLYHDTLPHGGGLSSSAAIEVATACALLRLSGGRDCVSAEDKIYLARIAQRAENNFVGVNCGIMDQFASAMGAAGQAMLLNCGTLDYEYIPLDLGRCKLVIMNTNKKRSLADSKYNERRDETERALAALQTVLPDITCLADVTPADFEAHRGGIADETVARRARHIVEECHRVYRATELLRGGDLTGFGALLDASHASLRDLYEVTGAELDMLVDCARRVDGVLGARMTGAGFGGCAIALADASVTAALEEMVTQAYTARFGYAPAFYLSDIGDGVRELLHV